MLPVRPDVRRRKASTLNGSGKSRRVYVYDGLSVLMPDSPANQRDYPLPDTQKPGLGFPLARIAAAFSLACGAVRRYAGKGQSELGMLRTLWDLFLPGDVMLADRLTCTWTEMVLFKQRGVDCVCRLTSHRKTDFRYGKRLGEDDHVVKWLKPAKPRSIDRETYNPLPEFLMIRECRVQVERPGVRVRMVIVATTLLDADEFTKDDLAQLYRARWNYAPVFKCIVCVSVGVTCGHRHATRTPGGGVALAV